jgi:imidazolonepropionase-like amidohydrolase
LSKQAINKDYKTFEQWSFKVVSLFNKYDVKIIAGTDTPIGFLIPGFSLHKELELLVEAGLTPLQALRAATITPAEFFNMEDKIGTVEVGKYADLVILNNNPLQNIQHTQDIHTVIVKGHIQAFLNQ